MNENTIKLAKQEFVILESGISNESHIKTGDVRKLFAKLYKINSNKYISKF